MNFEKELDNILRQRERELLRDIRVEIEKERRIEYYKKNNRQEIENYRDLVNEERELHRELKIVRERQEEGFTKEALIEGIRNEILENFNVQLDVLANIRRNQSKL